MPIHFAFPPIFTLLPVFLVLLSASSIPFVNAQKFQPIPVMGAGSTFIEGQGLYVFGGKDDSPEYMSIAQAFMIDLSVSWNTSDPVIKKLADSPGGLHPKVTVLPNKEEIFFLILGLGYTYNIKSNSWSSFVFNNKSPIETSSSDLATDPESGLVYFAAGKNGTDLNTVIPGLIAMDPRTGVFNMTKTPETGMRVTAGTRYVWNDSQRSLMSRSEYEPSTVFIYTPSRASESSHGWSMMNTTDPLGEDAPFLSCFMPAYNGSKMVHFRGFWPRMGDHGDWFEDGVVQILDIATRKWTAGPTAPFRDGASCAVSGDQVIIWGGINNEILYDSVLVYNMKTNERVSSYIAPPPITEDTSTDDTKLVIIIAVVTGVLLIIILTAIFTYLKTTKRSKAGTQTTTSNGLSSDSPGTVANIDIYGKVPTDALPRDPAFSGTDSKGASGSRKEQKFTVPDLLELEGAQPVPEHPHAIVEDTIAKRNVQEGAIGVQSISQHPHAMSKQDSTTEYNDKAELESPSEWGGKEELETSREWRSKEELESPRGWGDKEELEDE